MKIDGTVLVARFEDYDVVDPVEKGDYVGHPFRGNQWTDASGASTGGAGAAGRADIEMERKAFEMRQAGKTWDDIARELGYANGGSVRRLAMRHEARTKGTPDTPKPVVVKPPKQVDVKAGTEVKAARKLLDNAIGDDLWQALRDANASNGNDMSGPTTDAEKALVGSVVAAGALLAKAIDVELSKVAGTDIAKQNANTEEAENLRNELHASITEAEEARTNLSREVNTMLRKQDASKILESIDPLSEQRSLDDPKRMRNNDVAVIENLAGNVINELGRNVANGYTDFADLATMSDTQIDELAKSLGSWRRADGKFADPFSAVNIKTTSSDVAKDVYRQLVRETLSSKVYMKRLTKAISTQRTYKAVAASGEKRLVEIAADHTKFELTSADRQTATLNVLKSYGVKFGAATDVSVKVTDSTKSQEKMHANNVEDALGLIPSSLIAGSKPIVASNRFLKISPTDEAYYKAYPLSKIEISQSTSRAHAVNNGEGSISLRLDAGRATDSPKTMRQNKSTTLHEVVHGIEYSNPIVRQMESAYWNVRAGGEKVKSLSSITGLQGYSANERGVKDAWRQQYAGKFYGGDDSSGRGQSYEIMTTGMENVMYGGTTIDEGHRAFTLGVLAASAHMKDGS